jgi:hypothetical protein
MIKRSFFFSLFFFINALTAATWSDEGKTFKYETPIQFAATLHASSSSWLMGEGNGRRDGEVKWYSVETKYREARGKDLKGSKSHRG